MSKEIELEINKIYKEVYKKVFTEEELKSLSEGDRTSVAAKLVSIESSDKYEKFAEEFAKKLAKKGLSHKRGIWRKYYLAAKKAHYVALPKTFTAYEAAIMKKAITHNFTMIKSIPTKMMEILNHKYMSELIEEVAKGNLPRGSFKRLLEKHGHKQAGVIARTETAKLQTAILENRASSLGSIAYEWLSSNDKRTRPSHKAMNGVIVFWRQSDLEKPLLDGMYGNAGEFPNCRCSPEPIFDTDELKKSNYKVYDYKQHKIVNMSKKDVLELFTNNGF